MKVLKFGGTSVGTPERIEHIVQILKSYYSEGDSFTVVFSAFGGVTNQLIEMAELAAQGDDAYQEIFESFRQRHQLAVNHLLGDKGRPVAATLDENHEVLRNLLYGIFLVREASSRTMDYVLSFGERNAAFIITHVMQKAGIPCSYLDARKVIKTNKQFGNAKVDFQDTYKRIKKYYSEHPEVQVVTGFIASAKGGLTSTLGRGGSDYTASILAHGLDAKQIEIWTDVNGVLTADPRKVREAFTIPTMTYGEAMEMSHFGAKVIYPPTLQPALQKNIPLYIKNTFDPQFPGTLVSSMEDPSGPPVKGISSIDQISLLTVSGGGMFGVPGIAGRLFSALARAQVNIILITQGSSEHSISFAVQPKVAELSKSVVQEEFAYEIDRGAIQGVKIENDLAVVAIIGENMRLRPGIAGRLFEALGKNGINAVAIAQGSSELNISVVVDGENETKALNALHEAFFLSDKQQLHLYMVGVGLIGSTLLEQIQRQYQYLYDHQRMDVRVVGLANSKKMVFNSRGIPFDHWKNTLLEEGQKMSMPGFIEEMKKANLNNTIFIDNTASEKVASFYESILDSSISISTPNKIATSSSFLTYQRLKKIAEKRGVQFRYETNVGAGLPVINSLNDLIHSGDQLLRIEGVLSGSLSFIFNTFSSTDRAFSKIVEEARTLGFTEPDPRIDLNGFDVRRKLIILAREAGVALESEQVTIDPVLPEALRNANSVESFFTALPEYDEYFSEIRAKALAQNKVLRMIAQLEGMEARLALEAVDAAHPFYSLSGSDNMLVFYTDRYRERPLVIRGPGAGAEVTAAGVFAEIIRIGNYLS